MRRLPALTVLLTALVATVLPALPASASTPWCTTQVNYPVFSTDGGRTYYKAYLPRSSSSGGYLSCGLEPGLRNAGVTALQRSLRYCHGQDIAIDGAYGPATKEAVKNAQRWYNAHYSPDIAVDGYYGPQTLEAMKWYGYSNGSYRCGRAVFSGGA